MPWALSHRGSSPCCSQDLPAGRTTMTNNLRDCGRLTASVRRWSNESTTTSPLRGRSPRRTIDFPRDGSTRPGTARCRSEEHTSELQSRFDLVCRLLLEKKKQKIYLHILQLRTISTLTTYFIVHNELN